MYLVTVKYCKSEYMGDDVVITDNMTVDASSEDEAEEKIQKYFKNKSSEYDTQYYVYNIDIWPHIS